MLDQPPVIPDWEKERLIIVQPNLWRVYCRKGPRDVRPVFRRLTSALDELGVPYQFVGHDDAPLDIWIRDWGFVDRWWFRFAPSYAGGLYSRQTLHRARQRLEQLTGQRLRKVPLVLDGGNLVHNGEIAILTEKVLEDNPHLSRREIERMLCSLGFERVVFIPTEPGDVIGHADGMVRFLKRDVLLYNDYRGAGLEDFQRKFLKRLRDAGRCFELVPFPWYCTDEDYDGVPSAEGCYINFIQMKQGIVYPTFGHPFDELADKSLAFQTEQPRRPIEARALAKFGGVLNCASVSLIRG